MAERRKTKRRYLLYYGRVYDETAQKQLGYLVDITERGFMLLSDEQIPAGQTLHLKLELTLDIAKGPFMNFTAKSLVRGRPKSRSLQLRLRNRRN